jgi:hypothetical protein
VVAGRISLQGMETPASCKPGADSSPAGAKISAMASGRGNAPLRAGYLRGQGYAAGYLVSEAIPRYDCGVGQIAMAGSRPQGADAMADAKKVFLWLSFDLGVRGDYEGMYQFLDAHKAKECGDSLGSFWYDYKKDLIPELLKDLKSHVEVNKRSRLYLIFPKEGKRVGKFILGKRKAPPWAGFGPEEGEPEEDVGE